MAALYRQYLRSLHEQFGLYPSWLPNELRQLGEVGRLENGLFVRSRFLPPSSLGVPLLSSPAATFSHTSGKGTSITLKGTASTTPGGLMPQQSAGAVVSLAATGAFVFQAAGLTQVEVADLRVLGNHLVELWKAGQWELDDCVVTSVLTAQSLTVLVSESGSSSVELSANGNLGTGPTTLAQANVGLAVSSVTGQVLQFIAQADLTPLFRVSKLRRSVMEGLMDRDPRLGRAIGPISQDIPESLLEDVPPEI